MSGFMSDLKSLRKEVCQKLQKYKRTVKQEGKKDEVHEDIKWFNIDPKTLNIKINEFYNCYISFDANNKDSVDKYTDMMRLLAYEVGNYFLFGKQLDKEGNLIKRNDKDALMIMKALVLTKMYIEHSNLTETINNEQEKNFIADIVRSFETEFSNKFFYIDYYSDSINYIMFQLTQHNFNKKTKKIDDDFKKSLHDFMDSFIHSTSEKTKLADILYIYGICAIADDKKEVKVGIEDIELNEFAKKIESDDKAFLAKGKRMCATVVSDIQCINDFFTQEFGVNHFIPSMVDLKQIFTILNATNNEKEFIEKMDKKIIDGDFSTSPFPLLGDFITLYYICGAYKNDNTKNIVFNKIYALITSDDFIEYCIKLTDWKVLLRDINAGSIDVNKDKQLTEYLEKRLHMVPALKNIIKEDEKLNNIIKEKIINVFIKKLRETAKSQMVEGTKENIDDFIYEIEKGNSKKISLLSEGKNFEFLTKIIDEELEKQWIKKDDFRREILKRMKVLCECLDNKKKYTIEDHMRGVRKLQAYIALFVDEELTIENYRLERTSIEENGRDIYGKNAEEDTKYIKKWIDENKQVKNKKEEHILGSIHSILDSNKNRYMYINYIIDRIGNIVTNYDKGKTFLGKIDEIESLFTELYGVLTEEQQRILLKRLLRHCVLNIGNANTVKFYLQCYALKYKVYDVFLENENIFTLLNKHDKISAGYSGDMQSGIDILLKEYFNDNATLIAEIFTNDKKRNDFLIKELPELQKQIMGKSNISEQDGKLLFNILSNFSNFYGEQKGIYLNDEQTKKMKDLSDKLKKGTEDNNKKEIEKFLKEDVKIDNLDTDVIDSCNFNEIKQKIKNISDVEALVFPIVKNVENDNSIKLNEECRKQLNDANKTVKEKMNHYNNNLKKGLNTIDFFCKKNASQIINKSSDIVDEFKAIKNTEDFENPYLLFTQENKNDYSDFLKEDKTLTEEQIKQREDAYDNIVKDETIFDSINEKSLEKINKTKTILDDIKNDKLTIEDLNKKCLELSTTLGIDGVKNEQQLSNIIEEIDVDAFDKMKKMNNKYYNKTLTSYIDKNKGQFAEKLMVKEQKKKDENNGSGLEKAKAKVYNQKLKAQVLNVDNDIKTEVSEYYDKLDDKYGFKPKFTDTINMIKPGTEKTLKDVVDICKKKDIKKDINDVIVETKKVIEDTKDVVKEAYIENINKEYAENINKQEPVMQMAPQSVGISLKNNETNDKKTKQEDNKKEKKEKNNITKVAQPDAKEDEKIINIAGNKKQDKDELPWYINVLIALTIIGLIYLIVSYFSKKNKNNQTPQNSLQNLRIKDRIML